jgi:hypothetical protein
MSGKGVLGITAGVILLIVAAYYAMPNPGKKALRGEAIAVNNVSSWRIRTEVSSNGRLYLTRTHVAQCPDKERIVEFGLENISEYVRLGDDIYYRKGNGKWVKGTPGPDLFTPFPTPRPCLTNPNEPSSNPPGGAEEMKQWIETEASDGSISKGEMAEFKGTSCREWSLSRFTSRNQWGSYTACLHESDDLPVYWKGAGDRFSIYFEWDPSVTIEAPDVSATGMRMPAMP